MQAIFFIHLPIYKNHTINDTITSLDISSDHHIAILLVQNDRNYSLAGNPFALPKKYVLVLIFPGIIVSPLELLPTFNSFCVNNLIHEINNTIF